MPVVGGEGLGGPEPGGLLAGREGGARDGGGGAPALLNDGLDGGPSWWSEGPFGTRFCDRKSKTWKGQVVHIHAQEGLVQQLWRRY